MTEITLKLTFEELKQIDKYIEYHDYDCDKPLLEKIKNAYPKPTTLFDVIRNLGYSVDMCYEIVDAVEEFQKPKKPEKWDVVRESKKWCEEHPNESLEDYLTPQTPKEQEPEMLLLRQGKVDIVDYNHRTHYRIEYTDSFSGVYKWFVRKLGEVAFLEEIRDVNVYAPLEELYQKEVVKQKEEYPYKKYTPQERGDQIHKEVENEIEKLQEKNWYVAEENDWKTVALLFGKKLPVIPPYGYDELSPNAWYTWVVFNYDYYIKQRDIESGRYPTPPQTPEQIEKSLRTAFGKAQQTEKWKEIQKLIDEEDNDKNFKNSLDLIREWGEKNKPPTLKELLWEWWEDIFTRNSDLDADASIDYLVDILDRKFIPPSSDRNGYEWEKCLKMMRDKLR